ncbi:MAG: zinc-binding dehydrogenase [Bacteroidales bacterium]|nr:zinc-binding dehydrogenase [Bacteroidales bacterium]
MPAVIFNNNPKGMMKAVKLPQYQGNIIRALRSLELVDHTTPVLHPHQVMIAIEAAPCNPSDLAFIQGGYNIKKSIPAIPGFEGCGTVIDAGSSDEVTALLNERVSFFSQSDSGGSWATHTVVDATDCLIIHKDMPIEQAACFSVNPFTAYAMVRLAKNKGCKAIIQNAAGGQVARFVNVLAKREGIGVINIVRKEEHINQLSEAGYEHILCSAAEDFRENLKHRASALDARMAFDAVGGEQSGYMLQSMPGNSALYLYGALAASTLSEIPATDVIFRKKTIQGFNMNEWKNALDRNSFENISAELQQLFLSGILKTRIRQIYSLSEHGTALMQYIRNMSDGKIIFKP